MTVLDCKQKTLKHSSADANTSFLLRETWFSLYKSHFLYNEVPVKGHKSYYRILVPQAWDWFHFKWASLYTCTYLFWDLAVICRTSPWIAGSVSMGNSQMWSMAQGVSDQPGKWGGSRFGNVMFVPDVHWNLRALKLEYGLSKEANKSIFLCGMKRGASGKQLSTWDRLRMRVGS